MAGKIAQGTDYTYCVYDKAIATGLGVGSVLFFGGKSSHYNGSKPMLVLWDGLKTY